jgi:tRNA threonylcarbamoyladenosine biosynthesis protein TsaE
LKWASDPLQAQAGAKLAGINQSISGCRWIETQGVFMIEIATRSADHTAQLARHLAGCLKGGTVLALNGTLGSGKTCFVQGLAAGLEVNESVTSPTYTLSVPYSGKLDLVHVDAYRIQSDEEAFDLGLDELVAEGAVLVIEWYERFADALPKADLEIRILEGGTATCRTLTLTAFSSLGNSLIEQFDRQIASP